MTTGKLREPIRNRCETKWEMETEPDSAATRNLGPQPLDELMESLGLANRDLVEASTEQLTHKQVQKARKGRRVTSNIQKKILTALRKLQPEDADEPYQLVDLFNYRP